MEQEISIEEIMQKIKDEAARRKSSAGAEADSNAGSGGVQTGTGSEASYMKNKGVRLFIPLLPPAFDAAGSFFLTFPS